VTDPAPPSPERAPTPRTSRRLASPRTRRRAAAREIGYLAGLLATAGAVYGGLVLLPSKLRTRELRAERDTLQRELEDARDRIDRLERDTKALASDPWTIERALRTRLGHLRPGEHVFRPAPEEPSLDSEP